MLFNSVEFFIFLPIVFILYWFVFKSLRIQNIFIIIVSYIFYGWWDWRFLLLIALTTACSFASGILLEKFDNNKTKKKIVCSSNIILNLLILCYFKYCNFFGENFAAMFRIFGFEVDWVTLDILLPVGISFYTFQALSYTIDVYNKKMQPSHDPVAFFAFISFFPQLVAGPIERATNLLPQFLKSRTFDSEKATDGMRQILWGLFKKVVIADNCALAANHIFAEYQTLDSFNLFMGAIFFTFQIYGDFSGYSDIAIGTARLFGINLMQNFNFPYFSKNIPEFWRKWHISLTSWFRDYIYFPLGGSRCSKQKAIRNTLIIFFVSGIWHGANYTFIIWGLYHALLFIPWLLIDSKKYKNTVAPNKLLPSLKETAQMAITFILVVIGWIIFRAENTYQAFDYIYDMITGFTFSSPEFDPVILVYILLLLSVEWLQRTKQHGLQLQTCNKSNNILKYKSLRWAIYYILLIGTLLLQGVQEDFIYFQF